MSLSRRSDRVQDLQEQSKQLTELAEQRKTLLKAIRVIAARFAGQVLRGEHVENDSANGPQIHSISGSIEYVSAFLAAGGPVNYSNKSGDTMFHCAAENWHPEVLRLLLSYGAAADVQDESGRSAVHRWVEGPAPSISEAFHWTTEELAKRRSKSLNVMQIHGCSLKNLDSRGAAPLHVAVHERKPESTRLLLLAGADVHQTTSRNATPLALAFLNDDREMARLLLDWGADPKQSLPSYCYSNTLYDLVNCEGSEQMKSVFDAYVE